MSFPLYKGNASVSLELGKTTPSRLVALLRSVLDFEFRKGKLTVKGKTKGMRFLLYKGNVSVPL